MSIRIREMNRYLVFVVFAAICLSSVGRLSAQATDSILVGVVVDPSDAVVPDATVTATNRSTGVKYTAKTNATGEYRINNIPVGSYDVEASANGMASSRHQPGIARTSMMAPQIRRMMPVTRTITAATANAPRPASR